MTALKDSLINSTVVQALKGQTVTTSGGAVTSAAIDLLEYEGQGLLVVNSAKSSAGTTTTLIGKVTHCDTSGGSYADVTGAATAAIDEVTDNAKQVAFDVSAAKRYVKIVLTPTGTSGSWVCGATLHLVKKYQ